MKKIIALLLAVVMVLSLAACGGKKEDKFKVGFITLHDENSTYDKNFIDAAKAVCEKLGLKEGVDFFIKTGIDESIKCKDAALDLADEGCDLVFADSFGHEDFMIQAAKERPDVEFCHATGTRAHTEKLANYHNAFASIYEGRYLAGVAAGLKLNEMIAEGKFTAEEAKMGYVGAFTYAEVISGYTSFYLGAKSVCPSVTMDVQFTGSWYDETAEKEAANALIGKGCKLMSQHADSMGAPTACNEAGIPDVSYNGSTQKQCPDTYIISSRIDWQPYFEYIINAAKEGKEIKTDWTGTLATGSVALTDLNTDVAAEGTQAKLDEVKAGLENGTIKVFDTANFTVGGKALDATFKADVDSDKDYTPDTEVVKTENGITYFSESEFRSAPYFELKIDGINLLNEKV